MELSCVNNRLKASKGHFTATSICAGPTEQEDPLRKCQIGCEQHKLWSKASDCNLRLLDKTLDRERTCFVNLVAREANMTLAIAIVTRSWSAGIAMECPPPPKSVGRDS